MSFLFRTPYVNKPHVARYLYDTALNVPRSRGNYIAVDAFFGPAPTGRLKRWDGTSWVVKSVKHWNGTAWEIKPLKVWNGAAWI